MTAWEYKIVDSTQVTATAVAPAKPMRSFRMAIPPGANIQAPEMSRSLLAALVVAIAPLVASAGVAPAQTPGRTFPPAAPVPEGAFLGYFKSTLDSVPIQHVDVRLYFIDSTTQVTGPFGVKVLDTFVDTNRSRLAATDSTGYFTFWGVAPGRYLVNARRIGYSPIEAFVTIDSVIVFHTFVMPPIPGLLNKVEIREVAMSSLARRLDNVGFMSRKKFNGSQGSFAVAADLERYRPTTARDILARFGVFNGGVDILVDRMPLSYNDIKDYPASLIAAVEVYNHNRPIEFNQTRGAPNLFSSGGGGNRRPLVVIWTHVP